MFDLIGFIYEFIVDRLFWLIQVFVRLTCVMLAIPFVFFMPRGHAYQHLSYVQTLVVRFKFLGKSLTDAFKGNVS